MPTDAAIADRVTLELADAAMRPMLEGLAQFYVYDFSEMEPADSADFTFGNDGLFMPLPWFENFWGNAGAFALLVRYDGKPAGFICVDTISHADGGTIDHNMGEFFVVRQYRGAGVAQEALLQLLARYPGYWEFAVVERNDRAKAFWPKAVNAAPNVSEVACAEGDRVHWTGPIWSCVAS